MTEEGETVEHKEMRAPQESDKPKMPIYLIVWIGVLIGVFIGIGMTLT